jgi:hypothetical protein
MTKMTYDKTYEELDESISEAQAHGFLDTDSGLIMLGRILMSFERREINEEESVALISRIFPDYATKYGRAIQIALTGIPDEALEHTP